MHSYLSLVINSPSISVAIFCSGIITDKIAGDVANGAAVINRPAIDIGIFSGTFLSIIAYKITVDSSYFTIISVINRPSVSVSKR